MLVYHSSDLYQNKTTTTSVFYTLVNYKKYTFLEKTECKGNGKEKVIKKYKHTQNIYINSYIIVYNINSA